MAKLNAANQTQQVLTDLRNIRETILSTLVPRTGLIGGRNVPISMSFVDEQLAYRTLSFTAPDQRVPLRLKARNPEEVDQLTQMMQASTISPTADAAAAPSKPRQ